MTKHNGLPASPSNRPRTAFEDACVCVPLDHLTPLKFPEPSVKNTAKYQQILATVRDAGLVEPPAVVRDPHDAQRYLLLDGHLRVEALKDLGIKEVNCIIATNDDTYSYNKRINRLSAAQDHEMIARAIKLGVPREALAKLFGLSEKTIRQRARLLAGICKEAADRLADKQECPAKVFEILKKMVPLRQMEVVEIMVDQDNYSVQHANALLRMTPANQLVAKAKENAGRPPRTESIARQIAALQAHNRNLEDKYAADGGHWSTIELFLNELLTRKRLVRWLSDHKPQELGQLRSLVGMSEASPVDRRQRDPKHKPAKQRAASATEVAAHRVQP
jgi:hypothetical protein